MLVTPAKHKIGKHRMGDIFDMPERLAKVFIKAGKVAAVGSFYQTRMMQAEPAPVFVPEVAPVSASVPEAAESTESAESAESQATVETDSDGAEWDAAMHVATKLKNADGTWRKKPGAKAAL